MQLVEQVSQLSFIQREVFNLICWMERRHGWVQPSQSYIAKRMGITREYCNRILSKLKGLGLLQSKYRHLRTCVYKVSPFIWADGIRHALRPFFSALSFFSVQLLQITHSINKGLFRNNILYKYPSAKESGVEKHNPIPPAVRGIQHLKLSKWGQIKLSAFPAEALIATDKALSYSQNIRDPFKWFMSMCVDYCKREGLSVDWEYSNHLAERYGMKDGAPLLLNTNYPVEEKSNVSYKPTYQSKPVVEKKVPKGIPSLTPEQVKQTYQYRKWTTQLQTANEGFAHALRHMIMELHVLDYSLIEPYVCSECP